MKLYIAIYVIGLLLAMGVSAGFTQDVEHPLTCVSNADNLTLTTFYPTNNEYDISDIIWEQLLDIEATRYIYVNFGEVQVWDVWQDTEGQWIINGDIDGEPIQVWIWWSAIADEYYLLPFKDTTTSPVEGEDYLGIHPCGGWAVRSSDVTLPIIEIINNDDRVIRRQK